MTAIATTAVILVMKKRIKLLYLNHRNFVLYAIFGAISTGLEFALYSALCLVMPFQWANVIGFHVGILCSFYLNRHFNFKVEDNIMLRFVSFYLVQLVGLGISSLTLHILINVFGFGNNLAKLISIAVVALLLFLLNNYITFRKSSR